MPKLTHHHLHRVIVDGIQLPIVVNARSQAAVREHFIEHHLRIERMTPEEAFRAGVNGAVIEVAGKTSATAPQSDGEDAHHPIQDSMPITLSDQDAPSTAEATPDAAQSTGTGNAAAMTEAAGL